MLRRVEKIPAHLDCVTKLEHIYKKVKYPKIPQTIVSKKVFETHKLNFDFVTEYITNIGSQTRFHPKDGMGLSALDIEKLPSNSRELLEIIFCWRCPSICRRNVYADLTPP